VNVMLILAVLTALASRAPSLVVTMAFAMTVHVNVHMVLLVQHAIFYLVRTPKTVITVVHAIMALALVKKALQARAVRRSCARTTVLSTVFALMMAHVPAWLVLRAKFAMTTLLHAAPTSALMTSIKVTAQSLAASAAMASKEKTVRKKMCPDNCTSPAHGSCNSEGVCVCSANFTGPSCGDLKCPKDCSGNGECVMGKCMCSKGFITADCSKPACWPKMCSQRGACVDGVCKCSPGWGGVDCEKPGCGAHGTAQNGTCVCQSGFAGSRCEKKVCPNECSGHGGCLNGTCVCKPGYSGDDCGKRSLAPQRPYKCGVHCVRKCLRVSEDDFKAHGMAASRATYNNCTKDCISTCLRATSDEHASNVANEVNHPNAIDIPEDYLPSPPPALAMLPYGQLPKNGQAPE